MSEPAVNIPVYDFHDINGPKFVEVEIRGDGTVLWVHVNGITVLRMCRIENLKVLDNRINYTGG